MSEDEYYEDGEEGEEEADDAEAVAEAEDEAEDEYEDEEDADEEETKDRKAKSVMSVKSEGEEILMKRNEAKKGELDEQLKETINEWRKQRAKEEEELKKLKEQQAKRKERRAEEEVRLTKQKKEEEERIRAEETEKKAHEAEEKRKRLEEAEKKRQAMVSAQREKQESRGMIVEHKAPPVNTGGHKEVTKTKAQLEEEKKVCLSLRIKPLEIDGLETEQLKSKASELWEAVIRLETEKYDLEERGKRQGHDLKVLNERQIQRLRLKAVRMGLHAEALTGKYPPKIRMYSNFEMTRRGDTRTYADKKGLFSGGWEVISQEYLEKEWNDKSGDWNKQPKAKLPKWFGVRPGKRDDGPETPEEEEVVEADEDLLALDKEVVQVEEVEEEGDEEYEEEGDEEEEEEEEEE